MKGWNEQSVTAALDKLRERNIRVIDTRVKVKIKKPAIRKKEPAALTKMKQILISKGIHFVAEYNFLGNRKFRFDIAIPTKMVGIEYEGIFSAKSRHTTATGYSKDTVKYNLAVIAGWKVLRYTQLNWKEFINDLNKIL